MPAMKKPTRIQMTTSLACMLLASLLTACNSNPPKATACSLPEGPELNQAIALLRRFNPAHRDTPGTIGGNVHSIKHYT